jgi:MFS family permease
MTLFSTVLAQQIPQANTSVVLGSIFVALALVALPAGLVARRLGNRRAMVLGLAGMAFVCVALSVVQHSVVAIAIALLFGSTFSLVSNGTLPFALSMVPAPKAGLGTGMFFSGGAAASSLFGTLVDRIQALPPPVTALIGVLALLLAGLCITFAPRRLTVANQP